MPRSRFSDAAQTIVIGVFAITALICLIGVIVAFSPNSETGRLDPALVPLCSGPLAGSIGSIALIVLRKRINGLVVAGSVALWFLGVSLLGFGLFAVLTPGDDTFLTNFGFSLALCFTPGGVLTLLGLGIYWYQYTRNQPRPAATLSRGQVDLPLEVPLMEVPAVETAPPPDKESAAGPIDAAVRAADYRQRIEALVRDQKPGALSGQLALIPGRLASWEEQVRQLADRLHALETDPVIQRDRQGVPADVERLREQLATESDPQVRQQIEQTLAGLREQLLQLDRLAGLERRTRLRLEETLAAMGTVYSQLQLLATREVDGARAARLAEDIGRQTASLGDLVSALAEIRQS